MYKEIITEEMIYAFSMLNNDTKKSLEFFENILYKDNTNIGALNGKGIVLMKLEKYDEAETFFKSSLEIEENTVAYLNLGLINRVNKNINEANYYFDKASKLNSKLIKITDILKDNLDNHKENIKQCSILNN